jgi:hypothetical protein
MTTYHGGHRRPTLVAWRLLWREVRWVALLALILVIVLGGFG